MSLRRKVAHGAVLMTAVGGVREAVGFVVFLILARLLGPEAYGILGMALVVVALGQPLINESISESLVQAKEVTRGHYDSVFWVLVGLALALTALVWLGADLLAWVFDQPSVTALARWLSLIFILEALAAVPTAQLKRELRLGTLAVRSLIAVVVGGAVGIALALKGAGPWSLVGLHLSQRVTATVVLWLASGWRPGFEVSWRYVHDLKVYSLTMLAVRIVGVIDRQLPRFLIGVFLGPVALGYFTIAWRILEIMITLLVMPLGNVAFATFAHVQADLPRVREMLVSVSRYSAVIVVPGFAGLAAIAPDLIAPLFGAEWVPAIPTVQALCLLGIAHSQIVLANSLLRALGRPDRVLVLYLIGVAVAAAILPWAAWLGVFAVASALAARSFVMMPLPFREVQRAAQVAPMTLLRFQLPVLASTAVMVAAVLLWRDGLGDRLSDAQTLITSIAIGAVVYAGMIALLARPLLVEGVALARHLLPLRGRIVPAVRGSARP